MVKNITNTKKFSYKIKLSKSLKSLKKKIAKKGFKILVNDQKLWFVGKYLSDDSKSIYESGLRDECELQVYDQKDGDSTE